MRVLLIALLAAISYAQTDIPCIYGENKPEGCDPTRIKPCSEFSESEIDGLNIVENNINYNCASAAPRLKDTIFEGSSTNTYFVKFDKNRRGECYGIIMQGGESWGKQPNTNSDYDCLGKCGPGCTNGKANWARDCLKHDVCSWYFGASGAFFDGDCGDSWIQASNDYMRSGSACKEYGDTDINDGKAAVKVCHKDGCKGTRTNPIPRGEQWNFLRRKSETGCCYGKRGACDLCERPSLSKEGEAMIAENNKLKQANEALRKALETLSN